MIAIASPPAPPPEDPAVRERADRAVAMLAERLEKIADGCSTKLTKGEVACVDALFADAARDYQGYYGDHDDPRREQGRFDALPRLGGRGVEVDTVTARIAWVCNERCELARRVVLAEAKSAQLRKEREKEEKAREARRPKTEAQSKACYASCIHRCTGGRGIEPDEWCGTCEMSCRADCATSSR